MRDSGLDALLVTHPPNIRYLTGLSASAGVAVLTADRCVLVVDFRYATAARLLSDGAGLQIEVGEGSLDAAAVAAMKRLDVRRAGVEGDHLSLNRFNRIAGALAERSLPLAPADSTPALVPTERLVERMRAVKDAGEVEILREAGRRISSVARRARDWVVAGASEIEVAAAVDAAMRAAGFERPAFETIVASGPNSALPHARPTTATAGGRGGCGAGLRGRLRRILRGLDADAVHLGLMPPDFRRMFEAVRAAQAAAIAAVMPGAARRRYRRCRAVGAAGARAGARRSVTAPGTVWGWRCTRSRASRRRPRRDEPLTAGMVFTIEPGAYVPGLGGVRIEDDVLVVGGAASC